MNTIILRRVNIGNDAVVKEMEDNNVIEFSVADNRKYKDSNGEEKEQTTWFRCSMWTKNVKLADFLKKGTAVNVVGKLSAGAYINKSGAAAVDLKVTVNEVDLLSSAQKDQEENIPAPQAQEATEPLSEMNDEDKPF